jgi:hypothetical protein
VLVAPLYLAAGLVGEAYVGTTAATAVLLHVCRAIGYGIGGLVTEKALVLSLVAASAIITGNVVGLYLRRFAAKAPPRSIEATTLVVCVTLALCGVAH